MIESYNSIHEEVFSNIKEAMKTANLAHYCMSNYILYLFLASSKIFFTNDSNIEIFCSYSG